MGPDDRLQYAVLGMVIVQILSAYTMRESSWLSIVLVAYCWGGVINHAMTLAIHEISHNLAYGHQYPIHNRALGIFGNLILGNYACVFVRNLLKHGVLAVGCVI